MRSGSATCRICSILGPSGVEDVDLPIGRSTSATHTTDGYFAGRVLVHDAAGNYQSSWSADAQRARGGDPGSHPCNVTPTSEEMKEAQRYLHNYVDAYLARRRAYIENVARSKIALVLKIDKSAVDKGAIPILENRCRENALQQVVVDPTQITASLEDLFPSAGSVSCPFTMARSKASLAASCYMRVELSVRPI